MRIQILPLPSVVVGDDVQEPFALIVDQHDSDLDQQTADEWHRFKDSAGARALLITPDTVEVVDRFTEANPPEPTPPAEPATFGTLFGKPIRLEWPEGAPLGLTRQEIGEKLGSTLLEPNTTIVLRDRNGNPMNMSVTCSCGKAMGRTWTAIDPDPRQERTEIVCKSCGNRLTVTVPFGGQA